MDKEKQVAQPPFNADVEAFLLNAGSLEIDIQFGLTEYFRYLEDIRLLSLGFKFSELGIAERRRSSMPKMLSVNDAVAGTFRFVDEWKIDDPDATPSDSIALLKLSGVMRSQSGLCTTGADAMVDNLRNAYANKNVIGVIMETESGGGESIAGTKIKSAIQERNKPVIGFAHLAASAAYRALSGADEIIGSGLSAEFGSIGTMISLDQKALAMYRERYMDFYGKDAPGKNADFRKALAEDYSGIQKRVDSLTESFQKEIERDRALRGTPEQVREILNGSVYDAAKSKRYGMIDMIGNMQTAVRRVKALRGKYN